MTHHWEALGWTLVHFLWQGAAIGLIYRVADRALTRRSAAVRYVLALAALLSMPAAALVTLGYEEAAAGAQASASSGMAAHAELWAKSSVLPPASAPALEQPNGFPMERMLPYLDAVWLLGVLLLSLRTLGGWWMIRRLRVSRLEQAAHTVRLRLDVLRRQMGIGRYVTVHLSSRVANPLTAGVLRPWILLPITAITGLSSDELEVVLLHELAHIRRADYFWNLVQVMVETLFFFHPAVWWISRRVREERELCCDDMAVSRSASPTVYAGALLHLEEARREQLHLAMAFDGHQSRASLRARILRILGDAEEQPRGFRPVSLIGMAAALALFLCPLPRVFASFHALPSAPGPVLYPNSHAPAAMAAAAGAQAERSGEGTQAAPAPRQSAAAPAAAAQPEPPRRAHSDYIDQMRAAGYDVDLDKYIAMKVQGITPEYAAAMAKATGSRLTADQLIAMKVQDVTPAYMAEMRDAGYGADLNQYIAMKVQGITPAYADAMAKLGLGKPDASQLIAMKVQNVTPEFAAKMRADGMAASSFQDLITDRIFNVSPEFIAEMKSAGFDAIPPKKLIELRVQNVTPEFARSVKARFPDATVNDLVQFRIFHIDDAFIASAKRHGFTPITVQKLIRLRISGILDDGNDSDKGGPEKESHR